MDEVQKLIVHVVDGVAEKKYIYMHILSEQRYYTNDLIWTGSVLYYESVGEWNENNKV